MKRILPRIRGWWCRGSPGPRGSSILSPCSSTGPRWWPERARASGDRASTECRCTTRWLKRRSKQGANTSIVFVPARFAPAAVLDAIGAGMETIVVITEMIPQKDAIDFVNKADKKGIVIVGPNTPGAIAPPIKAKVGIMPAHVFKAGNIGIVSRSGTLTYEIASHLTNAGLGQSLCVGIGGDPIVGLDFITVLDMFEEDEETKGVVLIGEVGGVAEEMAARYIAESKYPKPVVAYIAGRSVPPGKRMGHAGAIIMGSEGTAKSKIDALTSAGVPVAERPSEIAALLRPRLRV